MFSARNERDGSDVRNVQDEVVFTNLFLAATNPAILNKLSESQKSDLNEILTNYTKMCINQINHVISSNDSINRIKPHFHK